MVHGNDVGPSYLTKKKKVLFSIQMLVMFIVISSSITSFRNVVPNYQLPEEAAVLKVAHSTLSNVPVEQQGHKIMTDNPSANSDDLNTSLLQLEEEYIFIPLQSKTCNQFGWCQDDNDDYYLRHNGKSNETSSRLPSHRKTEACLANKHLIFIGDSRVRFAYMALADYLKHRRWMKCQDQVQFNLSDLSCFLIDPNHYRKRMQSNSYNQYFNISNQMLTEMGTQEELCDCGREEPFHSTTTSENRYLRRKTPFGEIRITYLQSFKGVLQLHLDQFPPGVPFESEKARCKPGTCMQARTNISIVPAFYDIVTKLEPTHLIANAGWPDFDISCDLKQFNDAFPSVEVAYVSAPAIKRHRSRMDFEHLHKCIQNISVLDRTAMSMSGRSDWYWDKLHVLSILNRQFNVQLLEYLCG
jgi:hypothetical protein